VGPIRHVTSSGGDVELVYALRSLVFFYFVGLYKRAVFDAFRFFCMLGFSMVGHVDSWLTCEQFVCHLLTCRFV